MKKNKNVKNKKIKVEKVKKSKVETAKKKGIFSKIIYWLLIAFVALCILLFIGGVGFCIYIVKNAPEFDLQQMFEKESTKIYDADGNLYATLGTEQREKVTFDELPEVLIDAIVATEDSRFFTHSGFDAPRFIKAAIQQVLGMGGGGASTLTMQLSKLSFTSTESNGIQGIIRKFTDIYMSVFKIEKNLTKEQIFEYYVNTPCLGGNIYGVQQASKYYFDKDVQDLTLVEAAMIAGLFQSPNGYNPYNNPNDSNERKNTVLYLMKRHGYITESEYEAAKSVKITDYLGEGTTTTNEYQGFIDTVVQEVIDDTGNNPYDVPMIIYSTMRKDKQDIINNFYKNFDWPDEKMEIGIGAIDVNTGAIIAVGAGRDKSKAMTLNVATFSGQIKRQPGSTIKPIMDYGPAFEYANLSTYGPFIDEATPYGSGTMRNFNGKYSGFMTARDCLKNSINTCALQAFSMTTNEQKKEFATSLGIDITEDTIPQSYSIGAFNGVSPVQLAGAYAAFASGGYYTSPYSYTKIEYIETEEIYEKDISRTRVMTEQTAYLVTSILTQVTTSRLKVSGTQVATKTGTTSYDTSVLKKYGLTSNVIPDSWTSSYSPDYAIAIWMGYTTSLNEETVENGWYLRNSQYANTTRLVVQAAIGNEFYEKNSKFKSPGGIVSAKVELETIPAQSPSDYTPSDKIGTFLFLKGTEPSETSNRYSKLSDPSNLSYTTTGTTLNIKWTSPGTPQAIDKSYLTDYFNKGYSIWAEQYLSERLEYNEKNIGDFGFEVYLTKGSETTYLGWTWDTNYSVDLNNYPGYDGILVKSAYSIFKSNKSDGISKTFIIASTEEIDQSKIVITLNNSSIKKTLNSSYTELTSTDVTKILYGTTDITTSVTSLSLITNKVSKKDDTTWNGTPQEITASAGIYTVSYTLTFVYSGTTITKTLTQTITVE